jgi:hypothetical protein
VPGTLVFGWMLSGEHRRQPWHQLAMHMQCLRYGTSYNNSIKASRSSACSLQPAAVARHEHDKLALHCLQLDCSIQSSGSAVCTMHSRVKCRGMSEAALWLTSAVSHLASSCRPPVGAFDSSSSSGAIELKTKRKSNERQVRASEGAATAAHGHGPEFHRSA